MSRRKKQQSDGGSGNEWLQTYSDTVTLLLTFFVLLYSFATVDAKKFQQVSTAIQSVLSGQSANSIFEYNMKNGTKPIVGDLKKTGKGSGNSNALYEQVKEFVEKNKLNKTVKIRKNKLGIIMQLKDSVIFESGQSDIKENSKVILDKVTTLISTMPNEIIVEGHTDNVPINNDKYKSNWDLSTARAVNVLRYFVETKHLNPKRFNAAGYGEFKPLFNNDSDEHRAQNRRVNILIVASEKEKAKNE